MRADATTSKFLEIPTTLPTLDELLALHRGAKARETIFDLLRKGIGEDGADTGGAVLPETSFAVHSIHTEIEGGPVFFSWFAEQLRAWRSDGAIFLTIEEICRTLLPAGTPARNPRVPSKIPIKRLSFTMLPGRSTPVATGS